MSEEVIVGIDLGTTNSLVAYCDEQGPRILEGVAGDRLMPSVVRYERGEDGGVRAVVGRAARERAVEFPRSTIASAKRLMGRSAADGARDASFASHAIVADAGGSARFAVPIEGMDEPVVRSPQEVGAEILRALRARAEGALGVSVRKAVVTVPAYFDDAQRQATRDAGRIAGIEVVRIVNEPTAAALAYGLGLGGDRRERTIAVYDLGGGTFDISILRITPAGEAGDGAAAMPSFYRVLATAGDTNLGGDDVDHLLIERFLEGASASLGRAIGLGSLGPEARRALKQFAESVKHRLSEEEEAAVEIDLGVGFGGGADGAGVYRETILRAPFEEMIEPWVERSLRACERALRDAKIAAPAEELDAVVLVGGSTRVPLVRERVGAYFGIEPYAALNPDEVVALGASVQASVLAGKGAGGKSLLLDVIPLSLGIETAGGAVAKLIMRNSTVPTRATERFSTQVDGQRSIKLRVLQGEREMAEDCRSLGEFHLSGLPPMPAGMPQLEVEFLVDANGVLRVSAVEQRSGKRAAIQIVPNHGLTEADIERIERESVEHARSDMTRHRVVDLVVNGTLDCKWIGDRLEKFGGLLEAGYRAALTERLEAFVAMIARADADWTSVDANELHAAKQGLDELSVRLQEIAIRESLRGGGG